MKETDRQFINSRIDELRTELEKIESEKEKRYDERKSQYDKKMDNLREDIHSIFGSITHIQTAQATIITTLENNIQTSSDVIKSIKSSMVTKEQLECPEHKIELSSMKSSIDRLFGWVFTIVMSIIAISWKVIAGK